MEGELISDKQFLKRLIRELFVIPRAPDPCFVCGKYRHLCHAHHVIPVSQMAALCVSRVTFKELEKIPVRYIWLCPTHHALFHFIDRRPGDALVIEMLEQLDEAEVDAIWRIWEMRIFNKIN